MKLFLSKFDQIQSRTTKSNDNFQLTPKLTFKISSQQYTTQKKPESKKNIDLQKKLRKKSNKSKPQQYVFYKASL